MFASLDFSLSISLSRLSALLSHAAKINKIVFIRLFAIWLDANGSSGFENVSHDKNDEVEITFQFVFKSIFFSLHNFRSLLLRRNGIMNWKGKITLQSEERWNVVEKKDFQFTFRHKNLGVLDYIFWSFRFRILLPLFSHSFSISSQTISRYFRI